MSFFFDEISEDEKKRKKTKEARICFILGCILIVLMIFACGGLGIMLRELIECLFL